MKKTIGILWLTFCASALLGCPFESMHPLGDLDRASIDPRLIGTWSCREASDSSEAGGQLRIFQFDDRAYYLELDEGTGAEDRLRAYSSELGGQSWLNVQVISEPLPREFSFMAYRLESDGALIFHVLDDELLADQHASQAELVADVTAHLGKPALYDQPGFRCTRAESDSTDPGDRK